MGNQITLLKGPERVRKRPAVIFGSGDIDGVLNAIQILINILAQEGVSGHSNQITVTQYQDNSIEIQDNGRGIFLGEPDSVDDLIWKDLFCELYAGPVCGALSRSVFEAPNNANEQPADSFELCAVQYASEYMDICVIRDGFKHTLHFEKGNHVGGIKRTPCTGNTGTCIRLKLDSEVFSDISLHSQQLADKIQAIAIQIPGMRAIFRHKTAAGVEEAEFFYPKGIADYLQAQNENCVASPVYTAALVAEGQERYNKPRYTASANVGLCFAKDAGFIKCYHNLKELICGGTHRSAIVKEIVRYLDLGTGCEINKEEVLRHLQLVVITNSEITSWINGTRTAIENTLIRDLAQDTIRTDFHHFVKLNEEFLNDLLCR